MRASRPHDSPVDCLTRRLRAGRPRSNVGAIAVLLGFASLTSTYAGWVLPPSVREVSRGGAAGRREWVRRAGGE
jgi:hypothetical protein